MAQHKGLFLKKNFKLHVDLLSKGKIVGGSVPIPDSAVYPPPLPRYESWRALLHPIKLRFSVRADIERGARFEWDRDQQFLEREIDRLFHLGCVGLEGLLDIDSFRVVVQALDPFELESNIANMHKEADIFANNVISIHDFRSAMIFILREAGFKFYPHFPKTVFVWMKIHRNGTIYCPYEVPEKEAEERMEIESGRGTHAQHYIDPDYLGSEQESDYIYPSHRRPVAGSLTENLRPDTSGPLFNDFRTQKLLTKPSDKTGTTGLHATLGQKVGGIPVHKALALALACKRVPLMQCLTKPVTSVTEARERNRLGGHTQAEINAKRSNEEAAEAAYLESLEREREKMFKLRLPERDINGRRILPPAHGEKSAKDIFNQNDPLQVNKKLLFRGATKDNVRAFLAAKQVLSARGPPRKEDDPLATQDLQNFLSARAPHKETLPSSFRPPSSARHTPSEVFMIPENPPTRQQMWDGGGGNEGGGGGVVAKQEVLSARGSRRGEDGVGAAYTRNEQQGALAGGLKDDVLAPPPASHTPPEIFTLPEDVLTENQGGAAAVRFATTPQHHDISPSPQGGSSRDMCPQGRSTFCTRCGAGFDGGSNCSSCGAPVTASTLHPTTPGVPSTGLSTQFGEDWTRNFCTRCGAECDGGNHCSACGAPLTAMSQ